MKPEDLIGQNFFLFIPEQERESVRRHFISLNKKHPMATYEHQVLSPQGTFGGSNGLTDQFLMMRVMLGNTSPLDLMLRIAGEQRTNFEQARRSTGTYSIMPWSGSIEPG